MDLLNQLFQTHDSALTCLKWLSVLSVHGAEAQENHGGIFLHNTCLLSHPEYLLKVHSLAFIHHVNIAVRLKILFPFHNGCQIGCGIKRSSV